MYRQRLASITQTILNASVDPEMLCDSIMDLVDVFASCSGLRVPIGVKDARRGIDTGFGLALSPEDAARSMNDHIRTVQFIRGLHAAIQVAIEKFDTPIHVLYAGTGPYAPLALPLVTVFDAAQVQFIMLDIHQESLDSVANCVDKLGAEKYIKAYIKTDATRYSHPQESPIHIIVSETMRTGLQTETQVAITQNLAPQLCAGGILIPEKIEVHLSVVQHSKPEPEGPSVLNLHEDLGVAYELSATSGLLPDWQFDCDVATKIAGSTIVIPNRPWAERSGLVFTTCITVFQEIEISGQGSCLTLACPLPRMGDLHPGDKVQFYYEICRNPGMRYGVSD